MFGRSLLDELTQATQARAAAKKMPASPSAAASSSADGSMQPKQPDQPPSSILLTPTLKMKQQKIAAEAGPDPWEIREKVAEAFHKEMDPMIIVNVVDSLADQVVQSGDVEQVRLLDGVKGPYFYTGYMLSGAPIWKQIEARPCMSGPLYIFSAGPGSSDDSIGWWVSDAVWVSEKDMNKVSKHSNTKVERLLWADGDAYSPRHVHYPYWHADAHRDIVVMPLWDFSCLLIERCVSLQADLDSALQMHLQASDDAPAAADDDAEDQAKGKPKGKSGHGGWLPKMAQLLAALKASDWPYCFKLMDRFMESSAMLRKLVQDKAARKSLMDEDTDKGKGKGKKGKSKGKGKGKTAKDSEDD